MLIGIMMRGYDGPVPGSFFRRNEGKLFCCPAESLLISRIGQLDLLSGRAIMRYGARNDFSAEKSCWTEVPGFQYL